MVTRLNCNVRQERYFKQNNKDILKTHNFLFNS